MTEEHIICDQIALHGASALEAFKVVKEYYPETCDKKINSLIEKEVEKAKEKEEEYENFLIENNMTREEHERKIEEERTEEHKQSIKKYFMLSDEDMKNNDIDVLSLDEFYSINQALELVTKQIGYFPASEQWQKKLEETVDRIYLLSEDVDHKTMRQIFETIHIMESKFTNKTKPGSRGLSTKINSIKQVYASLEDSFAKRNDIFRKGKRMPGSGFSKI